MASPFDRLDAVSQRAVDVVNGEAFRFEPMAEAADVNAGDAPDPDRVVVDPVICVYHAPVARADAGPLARPGFLSESPGVIASRPVVTVQASRLPWRPRTNDRLIRAKTGEAFRVAEPKPTGNGQRWTLDLNIEAPPP